MNNCKQPDCRFKVFSEVLFENQTDDISDNVKSNFFILHCKHFKNEFSFAYGLYIVKMCH